MVKELIPEEGLKLVKFSGPQLIDRLGKDIISNVVLGVLLGENLRTLTEGLTQRRVLLTNVSAFITHLHLMTSYGGSDKQLNNLISEELNKGITKKKYLSENEKLYLYWMLGLTKKGIQNVTRGNEGISEYLTLMEKNLSEISKDINKTYGDIDVIVKSEGKDEVFLKWPNLLRCFLTIGAQTLTIRGSEKSVYGKLFEKFVLGTVLTILGAEYISRDDTRRDRMVFWLSDQNNKRESDATLLFRPGYGISFDIGFIGAGNPEVVMDKLTRFESKMERGGRRNLMSTIVLIDTLGENSSATKIAYEMGAHIVQMSNSYWVYELVRIIKDEQPGFEHPILKMSREESLNFIRERIKTIDISQFLSAVEFDE